VDRNKCILCRRCVRACTYINGVEAISVVYRGFKARIAFGADEPSWRIARASSAGAAWRSARPLPCTPRYRWAEGRAWQVKKVQTVCSYCGVGCQLVLEVKDNKIIKVDSAWDGPANHGWTCVKGRFGYDYVHHPDRLKKPRVRKYLLDGTPRNGDRGEWVEVDWETALEITASQAAPGQGRARTRHGWRVDICQMHQRRKLPDEQARPAGDRDE
jgi:predicted molibdopterin-dependent oxidoreductase YjgC